MLPILFRLPEWLPLVGGAPIRSFGVFIVLSFFAAGYVAGLEMKRKGMDPARMSDLVFWAFLGGIGGARLYSVLTDLDGLVADPRGTLLSGSGFTWYGGLILATVFVWVYMRRTQLPVGKTFDCIAMGMPAGIGVGRLGCFLAGDDYGMPTDSAFGVAFPQGAPPTTVEVFRSRYGIEVPPDMIERYGNVIPVHPTQLYEVGISVVIFLILLRLRKTEHGPGWMFAAWMGIYGVSRFILEIFRAKGDRFLFETFSQAQVISVALIVASLILTRRWSQPKGRRAAA